MRLRNEVEEVVRDAWSCRIERDAIELEATDLRVRYRATGAGIRASLKRRRSGEFVLKARYISTPRNVRELLTPELRLALAPEFIRYVAIDSYSGDSRSFRSDALRVSCRGLITEPTAVDQMLDAGVAVADRLHELGLVVPSPAKGQR